MNAAPAKAPVFMHVGLPKTGTSLIQALVEANQRGLRRAGVTALSQPVLLHQAASEIDGTKGVREDELPEGRWDQILSQVQAAQKAVFFSHERFSRLQEDGAARVVRDIARLGRELHVVISVRDLVAAEYSRWQEDVKNGWTNTFAEEGAKAVEDPSYLRTRQRARRTLKVWAKELPADRVHIVTVPPASSPRDLLPARFAEVMGVDPAALTANPPHRRNSSLDPVGTELVRRLNALEEGMDLFAQRSEIKLYLGSGGALSRDRSLVPPSPWGDYYDLCRAESRWMARFIAKHGLTVHGDLADLETVERSQEEPQGVTEAQVLAKALEAVALIAQRSHDRQQQIEEMDAAGGYAVNPQARMPRRLAQAVRREVYRYRRSR